MKTIYIIGALRNPKIPLLANDIQALGIEAFADWFSPGPDADDHWRDYSKARGLSFKQALQSPAAKHVFEFDKFHIDRCEGAVMLMPAGRSGHLELGYVLGQDKPGFILYDEEPARYDVMVQFATDIFFSKDELLDTLRNWNQIRQREVTHGPLTARGDRRPSDCSNLWRRKVRGS